MKKWWILALALYFASLLWLSFAIPETFVSPDENAAFTFAATLKETGRLMIEEPLNAAMQGLVHPRSVAAVGTWLVPGSFLGMPVLVGLFGHVFGIAGMVYVTPLLAALAVVAWYQIVRKVFNDARVATLAAVLMAAHPAFWLYAARSMMHNVVFVAFLVFAAWFVVVRPLSAWGERPARRLCEYMFAGACVGAALALRTSEVLWIAAGVVALGAFARRISLPQFLAFAGGAMVPLAVIALLQANLYGSPLSTGYTVGTSVAAPAQETVAAASPSILLEIGRNILPFGFHEKAILKNVWHFGVQLFPWMTLLAAAGAVCAWREKEQRTWRMWLATTVMLAAWLGVVYGSWSFNDNPDPTAVTLADSHLRYWLPAFVLATPLAALALVRIAGKRTKLRIALTVFVVACSGVLVFFGQDGFIASRRAVFASAAKREAILALTEDDAVVIADRADKFLWPRRRVVVPLRSESTYAGMPTLVALGPLYYFGIPFPQIDIDYLNNEKLAELGLRIDIVRTIDDEALYRITAR